MSKEVLNYLFANNIERNINSRKTILEYIYEQNIDIKKINSDHRDKIFYRALIIIVCDLVMLCISLIMGGLTVSFYRTVKFNQLSFFQIYEIRLESIISIITIFIFLLIWFVLKGRYTNRDPLYRHNLIAFKGSVFILFAVGLVQYLMQDTVSRLWLASTSIWISFLLSFSWWAGVTVMHQLGLWSTPLFVIGSKSAADEIEQMCLTQKSLGYVMTGQFDQSIIGRGDKEYAELVRQCGLQTKWREFEIVIAPEIAQFDDAFRLSRSLEIASIGHSIHLPLKSLPFSQLRSINPFGSNTILFATSNNLSRRVSKLLKRLIDILISFILIVLLIPLFIFVCIVLQVNGGNIIYKSNRIGYKGEVFKFYKFRSMVNNADQVLKDLLERDTDLAKHYSVYLKLPSDPRVTAFGRLLRKYSIDELPQLFNVLLGQMSLVGPRPILPNELVMYEDLQFYSSVRPGITGLWQIGGRSNLSFSDRIALDEWYVRNWSVTNDFVILIKTVKVVVTGQGAY